MAPRIDALGALNMSQLGYRLSNQPPTTINYNRVKASAFHDNRILIVSLDDPNLSWPDRILLEQIGERLHGRPKSASTTQLRTANGRKR